jgi:hypothetical protein
MPAPENAPEQAAPAEQHAGPPGDRGTPPPGGRAALAHLGAELLRRAEESQADLERAWDELMASWGIHGEPVPVERLRALIREESGASPGESGFSRELIGLREEDPS